MTLEVWTAPFGTRDPDRLDITRGSGKGALAFAPSENLLWSCRNANRRAEKLRDDAEELEAREEGGGLHLRRKAADIEEQVWADYEPRYLAEMRISKGMTPEHPHYGALERQAWSLGVRPDRAAWSALLARQRVVLACYCIDPEQCHRRLLARILAKCGAIDRGELPAPAPPIAQRANVDLEREELEEIVVGFGLLFREWSDVA